MNKENEYDEKYIKNYRKNCNWRD